jgi:NNP family nitrate/nitrite transporter-like MFS transporter
MNSQAKATKISLFNFRTPQMRAFHMSWIAFFLCFFAWFGMAPLMPVVRKELKLTPAQVGNIIIASVAITILARLLIGWFCDRIGPRRTYAWLLILGALPVMFIGLSKDYTTFLLFRLAIGAIGASFVITQYHTSVMFAPNCVGTANATTAGWGNMGGGMAQMLMPLLFAAFGAIGLSQFWSWRAAMVIPGVLMVLCGVAYYIFTQDTPEGDLVDLPARKPGQSKKGSGTFMQACADPRVWVLSLVYAASFGVEITIHNVAALYFTDSFKMSLTGAGLIVGAFGMMAIFARTLGGYISDLVNRRFGLNGRVMSLALVLLAEGLLLILFSRMGSITGAVVGLIAFGLFVHISCGATYAVIPFVNRNAIGSVAGVVGAGGNVGAVLSGFLFKGGLAWPTALLLLGLMVSACAVLTLLVRFVPESTGEARDSIDTTAAPDSAMAPAAV